MVEALPCLSYLGFCAVFCGTRVANECLWNIDRRVLKRGLQVEIADRLQESFASQFEPDTLLPVQYYELMRRRNILEGERKLMFAVLEDAIDCYLKNMNAKGRRRRILFYEVQNWMNARNRAGLFSYETLCETLEVDPNGLRAALERRFRHYQRMDRAAQEAA